MEFAISCVENARRDKGDYGEVDEMETKEVELLLNPFVHSGVGVVERVPVNGHATAGESDSCRRAETAMREDSVRLQNVKVKFQARPERLARVDPRGGDACVGGVEGV